LVTVVIFTLLRHGNLEIWHLYITGIVAGIFGAFQWPAYSAAISLMVPKKHYARTSGMISMAGSGVGIIAPILAGFPAAPDWVHWHHNGDHRHLGHRFVVPTRGSDPRAETS
jgi:MFS family permease